jgi:hypothetical protein
MAPPRRALIAITSAKAPLYPGDKDTGLFVTEALHPYNVFKAAGFKVDFISETGSFVPDWLSLQADWLKGEDKVAWEDRDSGFRAKLDDLLRPADVNASKVRNNSSRNISSDADDTCSMAFSLPQPDTQV